MANAVGPRPIPRTSVLEQRAERHDDFGVLRAEFGNLQHALEGAAEGFAGARIENPDVGDAEAEKVAHAFLHRAETVVSGEDLDADERRRPKDLVLWLITNHYANIGDAETSGRDLNPLFGHHVNAAIPCGERKSTR